ncbi:putative stress-induced protein STI1 [Auriculariales sp. MPI-PUGE-AT-0066]|nr:putative stress-induced protein STI1 [Auriculariales sp. MPI-PUGE-AT-0066]
MSDASALKDLGNKAFAAKQYDEAIDLFTKAIALDSSNHVLYSNRSAANAGKRQWSDALSDAEKCVEISPNWSKGYARVGAALHGLKRYDEAIQSYEKGITFEDSPALRKGLKEVKDAKESEEASAGADGIGKMFQDPQLYQKLAANPKTAHLLSDASFMNQLRMIQQNPQLAGNAFNDPRMISVLGVLMGIDMQGFAREEGSDELPPGVMSDTPRFEEEEVHVPPPAAKSAPPPAAKPAQSSKVEDVEMEEDNEETTAKKAALAEKQKGADAYKARKFDDAAAAFQKAWELWPKDVTFLTNLAAAQFEKGDYDACIATCENAIEEGRSIRADYKLIAKALGRTGSAYHRKGDLANAIKFYEKSLTEHRTPEILNKLREIEKEKTDADRKAYINPELSDKARDEGNALFKAGSFADAVKSYSEAIKRLPTDARAYTNRAAAYTKLAALPEALKDSEDAIKVDPTYIKAYIRKSLVLYGMKEYSKAMSACQEATDADTEKKHTREIEEQMTKLAMAMQTERASESEEQTLERAMRDPEVASIMNDPVMQQILQQAQGNPAALQDHMKNPVVRTKIQKLVAAGIIRTR